MMGDENGREVGTVAHEYSIFIEDSGASEFELDG